MDTALMKQVEQATGRLDKEALLARADDATKEMVRLATDPYLTFGATVDQHSIFMAIGTADDDQLEAKVWGQARERNISYDPAEWWRVLHALFRQLSSREVTGRRATDGLYSILTAAPSHEAADWAMRVLHKDLRCGVSVKTVMKVWPGLVQPFEVMLAMPTCDKHGNLIEGVEDLMAGVGFLEPKFDGVRCTVVAGQPFSRNGRLLDGVNHIIEDLGVNNAALLSNYVLDGEIVGATREESIGAARRKRGGYTVFYVFDIVHLSEWSTRNTDPLWKRKLELNSLKETGVVRRVPAISVFGAKLGLVVEHRDRWLAQGYEGAMWKAGLKPYQFKRGPHVLKFKMFETEDLEVIDYVEGAGKYEGMLGALVCRLPNGNTVNVGSGFSDSQRKEFWESREELPGTLVEAKYQVVKTTNDSLSHPVFVRRRLDK